MAWLIFKDLVQGKRSRKLWLIQFFTNPNKYKFNIAFPVKTINLVTQIDESNYRFGKIRTFCIGYGKVVKRVVMYR